MGRCVWFVWHLERMKGRNWIPVEMAFFIEVRPSVSAVVNGERGSNPALQGCASWERGQCCPSSLLQPPPKETTLLPAGTRAALLHVVLLESCSTAVIRCSLCGSQWRLKTTLQLITMINLGCELRYLWQGGEFATEHVEEHEHWECTGGRAVLWSYGRRERTQRMVW